MTMRKKDFKLLTLHGVSKPKKSDKYIFRNDFYLIGRIRFNPTGKIVRIIGYEMPLETTNKSKCINLFAYDSEYNPYIFEMKSSIEEKALSEIADEINTLGGMVSPILDFIAKEVREKLYWDCFKLTHNIKKVILAPTYYYQDKIVKKGDYPDLLICSFEPWKDTKDLVNKSRKKGFVDVDVLN